jgi:hypothetical protein
VRLEIALEGQYSDFLHALPAAGLE